MVEEGTSPQFSSGLQGPEGVSGTAVAALPGAGGQL